jgi:2-polyprenyl-6-methoxyphenol hydroxylase-like FAD-dependent oxidoreductase
MTGRTGTIGIVGAGIGGLAAAAFLRRQGLRVKVFEQAARFARVGAGIQMAPNPMKVLRALGVEDALRCMGFEPEVNLNRDFDTGKLTNLLEAGRTIEERYGAPYLCCHRADLHTTIKHLIPDEVISFGRKLVGIAQDATSVTLTFADGARERVDALIGADGVHSVVREAMLGKEEPRYTGRVAYRTTFPAALLGERQIEASRTKWWGVDRHIVIYYITANRDEVYFVTSQKEEAGWLTPESWSTRGDVRELQRAFADFHPDVLHVLDVCPEVYKWALLERDPLPRWCEGRVVLLGDACHPMPPYMAHGAAMALEDAAVLARCVEGVEPEGLAAAFRRFEWNRKDRATAIQQNSGKNNWMQYATDPDWVYGYDATTAELRDTAPPDTSAGPMQDCAPAGARA